MIEISVLKNISFMLALTLCTLLIAAFFLKHIKKMAPLHTTGIEILGVANLWNKNKVVLLRAYNTDLLIGVSDSTVQTLYVFDKKNELRNESIAAPKIREAKF